MSIAYQALVLFIYLSPGLVFRAIASTAGRFRQQRTITDELLLNVSVAFLAHVLMIFVFDVVGDRFGLSVDLDAVFMHAVGNYGKDSANLPWAIHAVTDHLPWVLLYFASVTALCALSGLLIRYCLGRKIIGDTLTQWFENEPNARRFREWSDILPTRSDDSLMLPLLATVVDFGKVSHLFVGILEDIHWAADGSPERFILSGVIRRPFDPDTDRKEAEEDPKFFYKVLGDRFVIKASEAKTLNILIRYMDSNELTANATGKKTWWKFWQWFSR